jgi:hypothetical protein
MSVRVSLAEIMDGMESQSYEMASYLNKRTGEMVFIRNMAGYRRSRAAEECHPLFGDC